MREIRQMLRRLCPDGVEYRKLGDVCEINKGIQFNKRDMNATGTYPVINGGIAPSGYIEQYNRCEETITVSQGGASAGFVNWLDRKFWAGAHCYTIVPSERVDNRFLFHFVKSREGKFKESQYGAGIPALPKLTLENLPVPVPPMAVQREIAATLDKFTTLEAELECRKKQYEFYRNALLSFDGSRAAGVEWARLGDVCEMRKGAAITKKDVEEGEIPVIAGGKKPAYFCNQPNRAPNTIVVAGSGAYAGFVSFWDRPIFVSDAFSIRGNDDVNTRYIYHWLKYKQTDIYKLKRGGGVPHVYLKEVAKMSVPVPPMAEQRRIVEILDRFDALTTSLSEGLPAEIKARREQYEFYRDRLLTFERKLL